MPKVTGTVNKIIDKGASVSFVVNDVWYGLNKERPNFSEKQAIEFDYTVNGTFNNVKVKDVRVVGAPQAAPATVSAGGAGTTNSRDVSIMFQSSRKDAIAIVSAALAAGAIKLPAAAGKQLDSVLALVDTIAADYYLKVVSVVEAGGVEVEDAITQSTEEEGTF